MLSHVLQVSCLLFRCKPDLDYNGTILVLFNFNLCYVLEFCMELEAD